MRRVCRQVSFAQIGVMAVGDGGINAVNRLLNQDVYGVDFIAVNSSLKGLQRSIAPQQLLLGDKVITGQGTGGDPLVAERAAYASWGSLEEIIQKYDMLFLTASLGGGTGSGATPVIAQVAKRLGVLTIGIVTTPFSFEGNRAKMVAQESIRRLRQFVDTLIVLPNDRLVELSGHSTNTLDAFHIGDSILHRSIRVIEELVSQPGLINVDFADVKTIMQEQGATLMTMGVASGENRAEEAALQAVACPVLDMTIQGARNLLVNITASPDLNLWEVDEATEVVRAMATGDANVIFGTAIDDLLQDEVRVTVIATGFDTQPHVGDFLVDEATEALQALFAAQEEAEAEEAAAVIGDGRTFVWPTFNQLSLAGVKAFRR